MLNHVHLLLETPCANVSAFMDCLLTSYAIYFNLRHHRSGHLTQGRFKSQVVQGDEYLLRLSRYIHVTPHANPGETYHDKSSSWRRAFFPSGAGIIVNICIFPPTDSDKSHGFNWGLKQRAKRLSRLSVPKSRWLPSRIKFKKAILSVGFV